MTNRKKEPDGSKRKKQNFRDEGKQPVDPTREYGPVGSELAICKTCGSMLVCIKCIPGKKKEPVGSKDPVDKTSSQRRKDVNPDVPLSFTDIGNKIKQAFMDPTSDNKKSEDVSKDPAEKTGTKRNLGDKGKQPIDPTRDKKKKLKVQSEDGSKDSVDKTRTKRNLGDKGKQPIDPTADNKSEDGSKDSVDKTRTKRNLGDKGKQPIDPTADNKSEDGSKDSVDKTRTKRNLGDKGKQPIDPTEQSEIATCETCGRVLVGGESCIRCLVKLLDVDDVRLRNEPMAPMLRLRCQKGCRDIQDVYVKTINGISNYLCSKCRGGWMDDLH